MQLSLSEKFDLNKKLPHISSGKTYTFPFYQYLNHTTGANIPGYPGYKKNEVVPSLKDILSGKGNVEPLMHNKNKQGQYLYSGHGYSAAQYLLETHLKKSLDDLLQEHICTRLKLSRTHYSIEPADQNHACGIYDNKTIKGGYRQYPEGSAAGLWTTPSELVSIAQYCNDTNILNIMTSSEFRVKTYSPKGWYFLGIRQAENGVYYHGGSNYGFKSRLEINPKTGEIICLMINNEGGKYVTDKDYIGLLA